MMLAFIKRQESYLPDSTIVDIQVKSDKYEEVTKYRVISNYIDIIGQDINVVSISAMPK